MKRSKKRVFYLAAVLIIVSAIIILIVYSKRLVSPPQEQFLKDDKVRMALDMASKKWSVPVESLYIMSTTSSSYWGEEVAIVDSINLRSAMVVFSDEATMAYEYIPKNKAEARIARRFYSTSWPFNEPDGPHYPIIGWMHLSPFGFGEIKTNGSIPYANVPVAFGLVFKIGTYFSN